MSWLGVCFVLLAQLALARRRRRGWLYAMAGNVCFMMEFCDRDGAITTLNLVLFFVALWGFMAWRRN